MDLMTINLWDGQNKSQNIDLLELISKTCSFKGRLLADCGLTTQKALPLHIIKSLRKT